MMLPLLISFSGGRSSAFMTKFLIERFPTRTKVIVFANTGKEREETLEFVNECDTRWNCNVVWIEAHTQMQKGTGTEFRIVDFSTASRNGEPFKQLIQKFGIPNIAVPFCSRDLKKIIIHKYMRSLGYDIYETAIGFRSDEWERIEKRKSNPKTNEIFPLADLGIDKKCINNWWKQQDFDLKIKDYQGNCDCCFKKSRSKLVQIATEEPERFDWWANMENKYGNGIVFFREHTSATEIVDIASSKIPMYEDNDDYSCLC